MRLQLCISVLIDLIRYRADFIGLVNTEKISQWVVGAIVGEEDEGYRADIITRFVSMGSVSSYDLARLTPQELLNLKNFHSFFGVVVGLQQLPVARLSRSWKV